jgi:co-chaperonin GroES (HSP10)|tara:strand:- start:424 stop:681 length:258 start_codon:yes stop_codon:yes gene_type:complete
MKAIGKFILIHEIKEQQITESGILLTADDTNQQRYKKGSVIVPGTDVDTVFEGDIIYYDKSSGHSMMLNDEMVSVITERDIVVVL